GYWDRLHFGAESDDDGRYSVDVPAVESVCRVSASLDNAARSADGIRAGASGVDLVLARAGTLLLRFRDARSQALLPPPDFAFTGRRPGGRESQMLSLGWPLAPDQDGWYAQRLPAGRVELSVREDGSRAGYRPIELETELGPREPRRVEFSLQIGASLELRLAPEQAALPADHTVLLLEQEIFDEVRVDEHSWDGGRLGSTVFQRAVRLKPDDSATIRGLAPGRFRFKVFPDDLVLEPASVELGDGPHEPVLVRW